MFTYTSTENNGVYKWHYDFGDGQGSDFHSDDHTYLKAGTYSPSLTVENLGGKKATYTATNAIYVRDCSVWKLANPPNRYDERNWLERFIHRQTLPWEPTPAPTPEPQPAGDGVPEEAAGGQQHGFWSEVFLFPSNFLTVISPPQTGEGGSGQKFEQIQRVFTMMPEPKEAPPLLVDNMPPGVTTTTPIPAPDGGTPVPAPAFAPEIIPPGSVALEQSTPKPIPWPTTPTPAMAYVLKPDIPIVPETTVTPVPYVTARVRVVNPEIAEVITERPVVYNPRVITCQYTMCNGVCTNTQTAISNCGACGSACNQQAGQQCINGQCTLVCAAGLVNCNGVCVNTLTDPSNCGTCGAVCQGQGSSCSNGQCTTQPIVVQPVIRPVIRRIVVER